MNTIEEQTTFKPGGIIETVIDWSKIKWLPFNIGIFGYQLVMLSVGKLLGKVDATWGEIWRAAQICHIRLMLNSEGLCISFTSPVAKLETWTSDEIDNAKYHFYKEPTFEVTEDEALCLMEAAQKKVNEPTGRKYDYAQLFGFIFNLPIWIIGSLLGIDCWGLQIITWFNLPMFREVCSTGAARLLIECVKALAGLFKPFCDRHGFAVRL